MDRAGLVIFAGTEGLGKTTCDILGFSEETYFWDHG